MRALVKQDNLSPLWVGVGYLNQVAALLIQVTYAVIAGWVLFYFSRALTEGFVQITPPLAAAEYEAVKKNFLASLFWTSSSIFICGLVLYFGLKSGIERAVGFMMPTLFFVMVLLIIFNILPLQLREIQLTLVTEQMIREDQLQFQMGTVGCKNRSFVLY